VGHHARSWKAGGRGGTSINDHHVERLPGARPAGIHRLERHARGEHMAPLAWDGWPSTKAAHRSSHRASTWRKVGGRRGQERRGSGSPRAAGRKGCSRLPRGDGPGCMALEQAPDCSPRPWCSGGGASPLGAPRAICGQDRQSAGPTGRGAFPGLQADGFGPGLPGVGRVAALGLVRSCWR